MQLVYSNNIQGTDYDTVKDLYPDSNNPADEAIITAGNDVGLKYTTCIKTYSTAPPGLGFAVGDIIEMKRYSRASSDVSWVLKETLNYTVVEADEDVTLIFDSYVVYYGGAAKFTLQITSSTATERVYIGTYDEHKVDAVKVNSQTPNTLQDISDELAGDVNFLAAIAAKILSTPAVPLANDANGRVDVGTIEGVDATDQIATALKNATGFTAGGVWTFAKTQKVIAAVLAGKVQDKSGSSTVKEILDPDDGTTVIAEITPSATTPYRSITVL
ncbi:MAG: hypothetical protein GWO86_02960 [Planctomycetes bacterium]|nr:hypothetical protein [Planctomycetota bacterium]